VLHFIVGCGGPLLFNEIEHNGKNDCFIYLYIYELHWLTALTRQTQRIDDEALGMLPVLRFDLIESCQFY
jgi:hypothetical protein